MTRKQKLTNGVHTGDRMLDLDGKINLQKHPFKVGCMNKKFEGAEPSVVQVAHYLKGGIDQ